MKPSKNKGQILWTRRGVLGLLGLMIGTLRLVWGRGADTRPKLSMHEANYYRPHKESDKE